MRVTALLLTALCLLWLLAVPAWSAQQQERRVALVIGNGAYKDAPLRNPVHDARDMSRELKKLGFEVILRENASLRQMEDALDQFWASIRQGGTGLFFFAGHGLQVKGVNYLVPVDARILVEQDVRSSCLDANKVLGRMENAGNGLNIILLDACRNNPFTRSWRSADSGLAKMDAPTGTIIGYATAPDSVAADGDGKNGVYTKHLLDQMAVPGLGIETMLKRVRVGVLQDTGHKQTPWESSSLTGDFYFNRQGASTAQTAALQPLQPALPKFDAKAEKQRLAEEAARLRREKEELDQMQALRAEKDRLEAERQKIEQAKLLAMAPRPEERPKQTPANAVAPQPGSHEAMFGRLAKGHAAEARGYFEQALQSNPGDADARAGLAMALAFMGRDEDARLQVQRLAEAGPQTGHARLARGLLMGMGGEQDTAYQMTQATEEGADKVLAALCLATALVRSRQFDKGEAALASYQSLVAEPERGEHVARLARGLELKGRLAGSYAFRWRGGTQYFGCESNKFLVRFGIDGDTLTATTTDQFNCSARVLKVGGVRLEGTRLTLVIETPGLFFQCNQKMIVDLSQGVEEAQGTWEACVAGTDPIVMVRERDRRP